MEQRLSCNDCGAPKDYRERKSRDKTSKSADLTEGDDIPRNIEKKEDVNKQGNFLDKHEVSLDKPWMCIGTVGWGMFSPRPDTFGLFNLSGDTCGACGITWLVSMIADFQEKYEQSHVQGKKHYKNELIN